MEVILVLVDIKNVVKTSIIKKKSGIGTWIDKPVR